MACCQQLLLGILGYLSVCTCVLRVGSWATNRKVCFLADSDTEIWWVCISHYAHSSCSTQHQECGEQYCEVERAERQGWICMTLKPGFTMQLHKSGTLFRMEIDSTFLMSFACVRHLVDICEWLNECSKRLPSFQGLSLNPRSLVVSYSPTLPLYYPVINEYLGVCSPAKM